jgi:transposase InsO family protein
MNVFEFIDAEKAQYPIGLLCKALDVSRPGYYAHTRRPTSKHAERDAALGAKIAAIHASSGKRYGCPRVHDELREEGERVSRKRVGRIMKEHDLRGKRRRRYRVTTQSNHDFPIAPNVLARDFSATAPNQKWVGDITYIWTREGWLYLAVLIDLFSRRVVGWSMSDSLATDLPLRALHMAIQTRRPPRGLIHHTDRGCQYASAEYRAVLEQNGIVASMSRKGNCWDNAVAESFFATLKTELVRDIDFLRRDHARREVFAYIEGFYNRRRRHSALGYANPNKLEMIFEWIEKAA